MQFNDEFQSAFFLERLNRFLVRVDISGNQIFAHLADPGRLNELLIPGARMLLQISPGEHRKTAFTVMFIEHIGRWVSINSTLPNRMVLDSLNRQILPDLESAELIKAEFTLGHDRFDFLVTSATKKMILEVKGVTLAENGIARFPDAVTERGRRHLDHLVQLKSQGYETGVYFVIQRDDVISFEPHYERDPKFAHALVNANKHGVRLFAYSCKITAHAMEWHQRVKINL